MKIEALQDSVFFTFVQHIKHGYFREGTDWGFTMENIVDHSVVKSRWGYVKQVGPEVTQIAVGDYILIEGGKWTNAVEVDGEKLWRTKESFVELTSDTEPEGH